MSKEPRVDRAISLLMEEECLKKISKSQENLSEVLYFLDKEQKLIMFETFSKLENDEDKNKVFDGLMQIYPLSKEIVDYIISKDDSKDIIRCYDRGNTVIKYINKLIQQMKKNNVSIPKTLNDYESRIKLLETQKIEINENIKKIKNAEHKEKKLIEEVENLEKELKDLEYSYTKEALEKKRIELKNKINERKKIQNQYEKESKEIKDIEKELSQIKSGNNAFKKALLELKKVTDNLPDSEENE